ncbi:death ligand signal enhancer [Rhinoraja longicauda]
MWRLKALLCRALHRWHISGPSTSLRLPPTHCADDDLLNPAARLPTHCTFRSSPTDAQNGDAGEGKREEDEQRTRFYSKGLPRFSGFDAVGWGAAAVVFLQFARHLHHHFCHRVGPPESEAAPQLCVAGIVASALTPDRIGFSRCILPRSVDPDSISTSAAQSSSSAASSSPAGGAAVHYWAHPGSFENVEQDDPLFMKCTEHSEYNARAESHPQPQVQREEASSEEALNRATSDLQGAAKSSVSSIFNIIGLENVKAQDEDLAFSCFMVAARQGYRKAQYNVGVCYELGRGTARDIDKAMLYYSQAATQGHHLAQYRWARYLLEVKPERNVGDTQKAINQLKKAAKSGLREAQAYLGVFYTNKPHRDLEQAVSYFSMAARSGDAGSLFHLGMCCQRGWGVRMDTGRAADLYTQAAAAGHPDSLWALGVLHQQGHAGGGGGSWGRSSLRCVMSSPSLHAQDTPQALLPRQHGAPEADTVSQPMGVPVPTLLPHSWSTGCLRASPLSARAPCLGASLPAVEHWAGLPTARHTFLAGFS